MSRFKLTDKDAAILSEVYTNLKVSINHHS